MTVKELVNATDYDVYLHSMWDTHTPEPTMNRGVCNLLKGCSGIMELTVHKFTIEPEDVAIFAFIDLPVEVVKAIYRYNKFGG